MTLQAPRAQHERCAQESSALDQGNQVDVLVEEAGTICLFHLVTGRAEAWVNLRPECGWYRLVGALVVDESHTDTFAQWMRAEGLRVGVMAPRGTA